MKYGLPYEFKKPEPIKGFQELRWAGKRPFTGTVNYPAQLKETHGDSQNWDGKPWYNKLYWGDNLQVMSHLLKEFRGKVDLIYIDPPFDSKADYKKTIKRRGKEVKSDRSTFEEIQYGDIWTNDEYLQFMYERLILCRELLSDTGSIYLHCDWHRSHYLRGLLDEVFGYTNFINEVIWYYRRWNIESTSFASNHDTILMFQKGKKHTYNQLYIPKSEKSSAQGKSWKSVIGEDGIRRSIQTDEPTKGVPMPDVWDISMINPVAKERTEIGYPTQKPRMILQYPKDPDNLHPSQKPVALLEYLIKTYTDEGMVVLDNCMGSGSTGIACLNTNRRFIGIELDESYFNIAKCRIDNLSHL